MSINTFHVLDTILNLVPCQMCPVPSSFPLVKKNKNEINNNKTKDNMIDDMIK